MEMEKFAPSLFLLQLAEHHLSYHGIINGDDLVVFRVEAQTIFMSISFIDILRITPAANTSDIIDALTGWGTIIFCYSGIKCQNRFLSTMFDKLTTHKTRPFLSIPFLFKSFHPPNMYCGQLWYCEILITHLKITSDSLCMFVGREMKGGVHIFA